MEVCCGVSAECGSAKRLLFLERVGVIGEPPLSRVGDVGELTLWSDPCEESLVRFFLRKPSDGMEEALGLELELELELGPFRFCGTQGGGRRAWAEEANFLAISVARGTSSCVVECCCDRS